MHYLKILSTKTKQKGKCTLYNDVYNISEEFCKTPDCKKQLEIIAWQGKRGPKRKLTIETIITLNVFRFIFHIKDLKTFHKMAKTFNFVKEMPNYENFTKATNLSLEIMELFLTYLLMKNRNKNKTGIHYMDSTLLTVCLNRRINEHKVTKGFASRGKSTKGWFYGFKLHGVCSPAGHLESILITDGGIHDSSVVEDITKGMKGYFFADAGYLKKAEDLSKLSDLGIIICSATRKNMKRLMTLEQWGILCKRNIIESDWGVLKQNFFIEYHQSRSLRGLFRHYICSIIAYIIEYS